MTTDLAPRKRRAVRNIMEALHRWQQDDANLMAGAVSYFAALAFFPLLLVLISGIGLLIGFTQFGKDAEQQVLDAIAEQTSPQIRENVAMLLGRVDRDAGLGGPVGIFMLLFAAVAIFVQFESAFDRIWKIKEPQSIGLVATLRNLVLHRLRAFLMLLGVGALVIVTFVASLVLASIQKLAGHWLPGADWPWIVLQLASTVALNTVALTILYRFLPKVPVRWREASQGALITAAAWEAGRWIMTFFVLGDRFSAYGIVGSFLAVMLWIYFASAALFFGAEYVQVICSQGDQNGARRQSFGKKL